MSNFVTTNIRIPEEDYLRLKDEATRERKSLSAVIRKKITTHKQKLSESEIESLYERRRKIAENLNRKIKDFDVVSALREMRYEGKW